MPTVPTGCSVLVFLPWMLLPLVTQLISTNNSAEHINLLLRVDILPWVLSQYCYSLTNSHCYKRFSQLSFYKTKQNREVGTYIIKKKNQGLRQKASILHSSLLRNGMHEGGQKQKGRMKIEGLVRGGSDVGSSVSPQKMFWKHCWDKCVLNSTHGTHHDSSETGTKAV